MKHIPFSTGFLSLSAAAAVLLSAGCASSERMFRLGADHTHYAHPEQERLKGYAEGSAEKYRRFHQNGEEDIARGTQYDESLVNLWPFYLANANYTSILWPLIDWDAYGCAFRPFYNQEGMEYSILFPLSAWNPHNKDGWALNFYWNPENVGMVPLFNTPMGKGFHYYGPLWFFTDTHRLHDGREEPETMRGLFPLLWLNCDYDRKCCLLWPVACWRSDFNIRHGLTYFGPFWNWDTECGIFPVFRLNYGEFGMLKSYFFPFYIHREDLFFSIPYGRYFREYRKSFWPISVLDSPEKLFRKQSSLQWILPYYTGTDEFVTSQGKQRMDHHYSGVFPLYHYEEMDLWRRIGLGPFGLLASWHTGPNVTGAHLLGPFGFLWKKKTISEPAEQKKRSSFHLSALLLFHRGEKELLRWRDPPSAFTPYASCSGLVSRLRSGASPDELEKELAASFRLLGLEELLPEAGKNPRQLADRLEKEYRSERIREFHHAFLPFWYYESNDTGTKYRLLLPFLASWETRRPRFTENAVGAGLLRHTRHTENDMVRPADAADIDRMTENTSRTGLREYDLHSVFLWKHEKFRYLCWKKDVPSPVRKQTDSFRKDCAAGVLTLAEARKRERAFLDENTEMRTYERTTFPCRFGYLSIRSDRGERRMYLGGGLLAKRETVNDSDDLHVLGFLYRYQKKKDAEREFIFPFILRQKDAGRESISFAWHLFQRNYSGGECTGGYLFFIPYGKSSQDRNTSLQ